MKLSFKKIFTGICFLTLTSCAGDKADLEKAAYLLGKGGTANAEAALALIPDPATVTGSGRFQVVRMYAGAKAQAAGFDGVKILSVLVYKTGDDTITLVRNAITLASNADTLLSDAKTALSNLVNSADFTNETNTRTKNGILFQQGLIEFYQAISTALNTSSFPTSGQLNENLCRTQFTATNNNITSIKGNLTSSEADLTNSGLDGMTNIDPNPLVKLVDDFNAQVPAGTDPTSVNTICHYLYCQSGGTAPISGSCP